MSFFYGNAVDENNNNEVDESVAGGNNYNQDPLGQHENPGSKDPVENKFFLQPKKEIIIIIKPVLLL